jgi:hypothetical protein
MTQAKSRAKIKTTALAPASPSGGPLKIHNVSLEQIDPDVLEMKQMTGDFNRSQLLLPVLKLNQSRTQKEYYGKFVLYPAGQNPQPKVLSDTIRGHILTVRKIYQEYGKDFRRYTLEHFANQGTLKLFEVRTKTDERQQPREIAAGTLDELRRQYPNLRARWNVYFLMEDGTLARLFVKGASLKAYMDFQNAVPDTEALSTWIVEIGSRREANQMGEFLVMTFKKVATRDKSEVKPLQLLLVEALRQYDLSRVSEKTPDVTSGPAGGETEGDEPVIDVDADVSQPDNSEPTSEEIPF